MTHLLKTTFATAFTIAAIAGGSLAFAADNSKNGNDGNTNGNQTISRNSPSLEEKKLDPSTTGAITSCDDKAAKQQADCNAAKLLK